MGSILFKGGAGGGAADSSELTTKASDVLKGKSYVGNDTNDEVGTGTLDLSAKANATAAQVLKDKTFFTNNNQLPSSPLKGTMANVGALETTSKVRVNGNNLVLGMTNGAHITNGGSGTTGVPEVQTAFSNVASKMGITAAKVADGVTLSGVKGTYKGKGNAVQANVLAGKTFSTVSLSGVAGTMPNIASIEHMKSYAVNSGNIYIRMTNGAHVTNATSGYPEVYATQAEIANAFGVTADKIAYGYTLFGIAGTNYGGTQISPNSPFVNGKFANGVNINNFEVSSWGSNIGVSSGSDSKSMQNNDHIHITFKNYQYDNSMHSDSGAIFAYNKMISFSTIKTITIKFMPEKNTGDGFGYSNYYYMDEFYFQAGTTNGGSQLGRGCTSKDPDYSVEAGTMVTATWDVSNITANGYFSIHFSGGSYGSGSSDSYHWDYDPFFNIYSITFS